MKMTKKMFNEKEICTFTNVLINFLLLPIWICGFLTNELRVASYKLRVTIHCTSYKLLFTYELRATVYCINYELLFTYKLRVTIYCTSYELNLSCELRVSTYNVDCLKYLYYTRYSFLWPALYKISYS